MDLIARIIATRRGKAWLVWMIPGLTTVGILAFGVPPIALFLVPLSAMIITGHFEPWAERRLSRH